MWAAWREVEEKKKERLLATLVGQLRLVRFHPMLTTTANIISKRTVTDVTTPTITAGPRGVYHTQVLPRQGRLSEGDGVSLPLQVASTSEGMQLNTSSEMTALNIKAEGDERGEIRVDGGYRGKLDDKGGLARGFL